MPKTRELGISFYDRYLTRIMKKLLLCVFILTGLPGGSSKAQQVKSPYLNAHRLVQVAVVKLKHKDTIAAAANIHLAQAYLPKVNSSEVSKLKADIIQFYVLWVKLKNPPSRGQLDDRSIKINKLVNALTGKSATLGSATTYFSTAASLAILADNKSLYIFSKMSYAESLVANGAPSVAVSVLDSLAEEPTLTDYEKIRILSLLVINKVILKQNKNLDVYYSQLQSLNKITSGKLDQQEYLFAVAMYCGSKGLYNQAARSYRSALSVFAKTGVYDEEFAEALIGFASLWDKQFHLDSARFYFKKAQLIIKNHKEFNNAAQQYKQAYAIYKLHLSSKTGTGDNTINQDTIYHHELKTATAELEYKYQLALKNQKLKLITQQKQLDQLAYERNRQRNWLIILSLLILLTISFAAIYIFYQRRRRTALLHEAEIEHIKQEHRLEVVRVLSGARERERLRIAEQLHDEVGSMIAVARLNLSSGKNGNELFGISHAQLRQVNQILSDVATTIREISHQLMPVTLRKLGFKKSILQLIDDVNRTDKIMVHHIIVGFDDENKYTDEFQLQFYHIMQELFQNIIKHSAATEAHLQLVEHEDEVNLMMEDNGSGISVQNTKKGFGMELLKNRVDLFEGNITIESTPGLGTLIIINVPIQNIVYSSEISNLGYSKTLPG